MSIPPIGGDHPEIEVHYQKEEDKKVQLEFLVSFQRDEIAIHKALEHSAGSWGERLQKLPQKIAGKVEILKGALVELDEPCFKYCELISRLDDLQETLLNLSSDEENEAGIQKQRADLAVQIEALDQPVEEADKRMNTFIEGFITENKKLGITKEFFSDCWKINVIEEHKWKISLSFIKEQIINRCVNNLCFLSDTRAAIEKQKNIIIQQFYQGDGSTVDLKEVTFELFPHGSETHNRGKIPVRVFFFLGEIELFSIFFKPRDARIDAKIIEVFRALNALSREEKSLDVALPTYTIRNISDPTNPYSLWEFIDGLKKEGETASEIIESLSNTSEKEILHHQLLRLQSICKFLDISDLHVENLIFANLGERNPQIIPIDLESIQPGNSTGLFTNDPDTPPFTKAEKKLLDACKQDIGEVPVRFVPIPTSHFLSGLTRCDSFARMARLVEQSIQEMKYHLSIPKEELEWLILNDFLHNDVPYLTEYKSRIYYICSDEPKEIARK